jgi:long-chain acyl-CoA synthetase
MVKRDGRYRGITYTELRRSVDLFAGGLAALGLKRGDRVSIISENRPEWVVADQAIAALGAVSVPIFPTMTAKQNEFIFNDAGVRYVIVSNRFQLNKVLRVTPAVATLEKVILLNEKDAVPDKQVITFARVTEMGRAFLEENSGYMQASSDLVQPEDLLTLIYTSGTTGNPKGVMLTHGNLSSNITAAAEVIPIGPEETLLSFLPLCHSFERMAGYYAAMACGAMIVYAERIETVPENMIEVRPTIVTTVPRLFERMHSRILKQVESGSVLRKKIFFWAVGTGRGFAEAERKGRPSAMLRVRRILADLLVFRKIRARTGGRIKFFVSGGAALAREFGEFFEAVGIKIIEGYGLTETSPVISVNRLTNYKFGTVGKPIPGVEVRFAGDGEILARGPNIMKGYWNNKAATDEVIDGEGWLHTGDIGSLDSEGMIRITDRKKHLFVSSGGKNIAPQPIESLFLSSRYIEQFVLIGDRRSFLTALIVPDFDALREFADSRNLSYKDPAELASHPDVNTLLEKEIGALQRDLATYERVRKFTLLERPFTIDEGELTPTLKVRRSFIEQRYADTIKKMYEGID